MAKMKRRGEAGFSMTELLVVLLVVSVLLTVAVPFYMGFQKKARDTAARSALTLSAKTATGLSAHAGGFPTAAELALSEPSLDFSGATDESLHVLVEDVVSASGDRAQILIWTRSDGGPWYGIRMIQIGSDAGRYTCEGSAESDVDTMAACGLSTDW